MIGRAYITNQVRTNPPARQPTANQPLRGRRRRNIGGNPPPQPNLSFLQPER